MSSAPLVKTNPKSFLAKHYLLFYDACDNHAAKRTVFRDLHLKHAWAAHERGELLLAGALADPVDGAVLLFQGNTLEGPSAHRLG